MHYPCVCSPVYVLLCVLLFCIFHYSALTYFSSTFIEHSRYNFDDSSVREVQADECVNPAAYILFYARCDALGALNRL